MIPIVCDYCGKRNSLADENCKSCGAPLGESDGCYLVSMGSRFMGHEIFLKIPGNMMWHSDDIKSHYRNYMDFHSSTMFPDSLRATT